MFGDTCTTLRPDCSNGVDDLSTLVGSRCEALPGFCAIQTNGTCEVAAALLGLSDTTAGTPISNTAKTPGCFVSRC